MSHSFVTPWTVDYQDSLSMGFSRQEYWSGLSLPAPGDLPSPGMEPMSPALAGRSFATEPPGKSPQHSLWCKNIIKTGDARGFSVLINFDLWYFSVKEKLPAGGPDSTWRGLGWFANNRSWPGLGWCMLCALGRAQREAGGIQEQPSAVFVLSLLASWMAKSGQSGHKVWSCGWKPLGSEGWQQTLPSSKSAASWKTCLFVKWCLKQVWAWVV